MTRQERSPSNPENHFTLLSAEEEKEMAILIETGRTAETRLETDDGQLSPWEKESLSFSIQEGERAKETLVLANQRLVKSIAFHFQGKGLDFEDLVNEGNLGCLKAVEKYDWHLGFKFSTYATWWIRKSIRRAVQNYSRTIRVPVYLQNQIWKMKQTREAFIAEEKREPSDKELADQLDLEVEEIEYLLELDQPIFSFEKRRGTEVEDDVINLLNLVKDEQALSTPEAVEDLQLKETISNLLQTLPPRERKVIEMRFGFEDGRKRTLEEVGQEIGLTRERIRQIEQKALRRLRHPSKAKQLRVFINPTRD
jgi:RNA polymerase primary sigma factor